MGTNKAEEKMTREQFIMKYLGNSTINWSEEHCDMMRNDLDKVINYHDRQSEIDELTKEVEILEEWNKKYEDNQVENFERVKNQEHKIVELTKEVERLKVLNKRLFTLWESLYSPNKLII